MVELSISLIIIAMLLAGAMVGKNMIRQSNLRSITTDYGIFRQAIENFKTAYGYSPGDMPTASSSWQYDKFGTAAANTTTNGNGDGLINSLTETFNAWNQLNQAGFIPGAYSVDVTGTIECRPSTSATTKQNVPASRYDPSSGYWFTTGNIASGDNYQTTMTETYIVLGLYRASNGCDNSILIPADALAVDQKNDDGLASSGDIRLYQASGDDTCGVGVNSIVAAPGTTPFGYDTAVVTVACEMAFRLY